MHDIIPDIHGHSGKLTALLTKLGYRERNNAWRHPDPSRQCVFLGDYIDRGPDNAGAIDIVRRMVDSGTAKAIMGNHELNAIHYHTAHPDTGDPLREHNNKNKSQHASFLKEFPTGEPHTADVVNWMKALPLFLEIDGFRAVHACWDEHVIAEVKKVTPAGRMNEQQLIAAGREKTDPYRWVEALAKGPEARLPEPNFIYDKGGHKRTHVRVKWWQPKVETWQDIAMSVPNPRQLPTERPGQDVLKSVYPSDAAPVFFGHYWLNGTPKLQAPNALCLDYSAGTSGPLIAYRLEGTDAPLSLLNIVSI